MAKSITILICLSNLINVLKINITISSLPNQDNPYSYKKVIPLHAMEALGGRGGIASNHS
jgi:hypothetical protein